MIKSITLRDFQSYTKQTFTFDKHVTCITGPSDVGKSTIFRALKWAVLNKPSTKWNRRIGKGKRTPTTSVVLKIHGKKVTRKRTNRGNEYKIGKKSFKAFGSEVPPDVRKVLRLEDVNFQNQLDGPYWFQLPAGHVAKRLNEIIDLSLIDRLQENMARRVRQGESEHKVLKEQVKTLEEEVNGLKWIVQCRKEWKRLRGLKAERNALAREREGIEALLREIPGKELERLESCLIAFRPIRETAEKLIAIKKERKSLSELVKEYDGLDIEGHEQCLKEFQVLNQIRIEADKFAENRRTLSMHCDNFDESVRERKGMEERLIEYQKNLETLKKKRCPTCGRQLKPLPSQ